MKFNELVSITRLTRLKGDWLARNAVLAKIYSQLSDLHHGDLLARRVECGCLRPCEPFKRSLFHALLAKSINLCAFRAGDALSRYITVRLAWLECVSVRLSK